MNDRSKARLIADRINKLERKNKAHLSVFRAVSDGGVGMKRRRSNEV